MSELKLSWNDEEWEYLFFCPNVSETMVKKLFLATEGMDEVCATALDRQHPLDLCSEPSPQVDKSALC